jgi:hypothetical protein
MLFRVCEHYYENQEMFQNNYNECFICFEYEMGNEKKPIYLQKQQLYLNNCICDGNVHNLCLQKWFNIHKSCPICRIKVVEYNNATVIIYNFVPFGIKIYTFIRSNVMRFVRVISVLLFFYAIMDFYLLLFISKNHPQYDASDYLPNIDEYRDFFNDSDE